MMKKMRFLISVVFLIFTMSLYAEAYSVFPRNNNGTVHRKHNKQRKHHGGGHGNTTGAPLDGGLLTILGAAGVSYYLIRKKEKRS